MSNWKTGKELMVLWDIEGFDFFACLEKGLQPYTRYGHKIANTDTLEHAPFFSLEQCVARIRRANVGTLVESGARHQHFEPFTPMFEQEILEKAKKSYESQPLHPVNPPMHHISFTLPPDDRRAAEAIEEMMHLRFRKDEALEFARKNGFPELNQPEVVTPELKYNKWVSGEEIKNTLRIDDANLINLIAEGRLTAHTEGLEELGLDEIRFMMNNPVGQLSPAWSPAGIDGFRFRRAEFLKLTGEQQPAAEAETSFAGAEANENRPCNPSAESEQEQSISCEDFVRSLRFYYGNDSEIKIQQPGRKAKTFTHNSLGFEASDTEEWKSFRRVIKGPEPFYNVGPAADRKTYDNNMKRLFRINEKLIEHYLKKECQLQVPKKFKLYEKTPEEGPGVYRFIFLVENDARNFEHCDGSKEKWWARFNLLGGQLNTISATGKDQEINSLKMRIAEEVKRALVNVINLTTRLIIHMMLSLVDLVITLKFASWANRFSGGNEDSMYSLDQLHNHIPWSFKKQKQSIFGFRNGLRHIYLILVLFILIFILDNILSR